MCPRQNKAERIHLHQTSIVRYAKGTASKTRRKKVREREEHRYEKMATNKYLSIITLNINGLNAPNKNIE